MPVVTPRLTGHNARNAPGIHVCIHEYIVFGPSSSLSHSSPPQWCIACATALISNKIHANAHPVAGSMSHDAVKVSPHTHCKPAIFPVYKLVYCQARPRENRVAAVTHAAQCITIEEP